MFCVEIRSPLGIEGEFRVQTAVLALDLALHAERTGMEWWASAGEDGGNLSLGELRARAVAHADGRPADSLLLHDVDLRHHRAVRQACN